MKLIDEEKNSNNLMCGLQYPHPTYSFSQQIIDEWKMIENRHKKWSQWALAIWSPHKQGYLASNKLFFSSKLKKSSNLQSPSSLEISAVSLPKTKENPLQNELPRPFLQGKEGKRFGHLSSSYPLLKTIKTHLNQI